MRTREMEKAVNKAFNDWVTGLEKGVDGHVKWLVENTVKRHLEDMVRNKVRSGTAFRAKLDAAAEKWVKKAVSAAELELQPYKNNELSTELKRVFAKHLKWQLSSRAEDHAEELSRKVVNKVLKIRETPATRRRR